MLQTIQTNDGQQFFRDDQDRLFLVSDFNQLYQYLQSGGFVVSAWQKDKSPAENEKNHVALMRELLKMKFSMMEWCAEFSQGESWTNRRALSVAVMYNPVLNESFSVFRQKAIGLREKFGQSCFFIVENAGANVRFLHSAPRARFIFRDMAPELLPGFEAGQDEGYFFETLHQTHGLHSPDKNSDYVIVKKSSRPLRYMNCSRRWYTSGLQSFGRRKEAG